MFTACILCVVLIGWFVVLWCRVVGLLCNPAPLAAHCTPVMKFGAVITCRTIPGHVSAVFLQFPHFLMFPVPDFPTACRLWLSSGLLDRCATCAMVASYVLAYSIALSCVKSSPCSSMRS